MNERDKVLDLLSLYYGVPVSFITRRVCIQQDYQDEFHANGTIPIYGARSKYITPARWYWWYWLMHRGMSWVEVAFIEGYNHSTVYHANKNRHLVEDRNANQIIYETNSIRY